MIASVLTVGAAVVFFIVRAVRRSATLEEGTLEEGILEEGIPEEGSLDPRRPATPGLLQTDDARA